MLVRFHKGGYTPKEMDGYKDEQGVERNGLKDFVWAYVQSEIVAEVEKARQDLLDVLQPAEKTYLNGF